MRVADKMAFTQINRNVTKNRSEMADLQNQAATLKRVVRPSDDPLAATRVLGLRTDISGNEQFLKTSRQAQSFLDYTDQSLSDFSEVLIRVKELVLSQASDAGASESTRKLVAGEVDQLMQQSIQIGNRRLGDTYLFGGYKTTTPPFSAEGKYQGDDGEILMAINKDTYVTSSIPGSKVFLGKESLSHDIGNRDIVEPKKIEDIELAQQQKRNIDQAKSEKGNSLDGDGINRAEPSLRGPASIQSSMSSINSEPSEEATVSSFNKDVGRVGGLNAAEEKGENIFSLLKKISISMKTNDKEGIQDSANSLDDALSQVVLSRAELGGRMNTVEANMESLKKLNIDSKGAASILEDADQFEVISDINKTESALRATLQTSGKMVQSSLLDFLR